MVDLKVLQQACNAKFTCSMDIIIMFGSLILLHRTPGCLHSSQEAEWEEIVELMRPKNDLLLIRHCNIAFA